MVGLPYSANHVALPLPPLGEPCGLAAAAVAVESDLYDFLLVGVEEHYAVILEVESFEVHADHVILERPLVLEFVLLAVRGLTGPFADYPIAARLLHEVGQGLLCRRSGTPDQETDRGCQNDPCHVALESCGC
jgi:hypothetical protein